MIARWGNSLLMEGVTYDELTQRELLLTIQEEEERLHRFVGNLSSSSGGERFIPVVPSEHCCVRVYTRSS